MKACPVCGGPICAACVINHILMEPAPLKRQIPSSGLVYWAQKRDKEALNAL